ncbi:MAG: Fur family transcriptional regulator, ferric uptake regulator [Clostridiales bacterium]|jgi:Fur family ferric uptake transcriptional regulator|nr:Fur family transcriptional regulator, ferric uptake regulator [Clostridiales bacterium]MDK2934439.1 Fur family transcriptional regulator, ferric uptake regulator [Clostridiales bacterium]
MDNRLKKILTNQNYKMTKQRKAILQILSESDTCLSAEEIYLQAKKLNPSTCLTTVYRTIELLAENNLLNKVNFGDNKYRYEINSSLHHHHIICLGCKKMIEITECPVSRLEKNIKTQTQFKITGHRLELYGYCPDCQQAI